MKPSALGLPFARFRPGQLEAIAAIARSKAAVSVYDAPVGSGKSGVAVGLFRYLGAEGGILVPDIGLQDQYVRALEGLTSMMGRDHFDCIIGPGKASHAPCMGDFLCHERVTPGHPRGDCPYYKQRHVGLLSELFITNYAMHVALVKAGVAPYDDRFPELLVCDEAHRLEDTLADQYSISLSESELAHVGVRADLFGLKDMASLSGWAKLRLEDVATRMERAVQSEQGALGRVRDKLEALAKAPESMVLYVEPHSITARPTEMAPLFQQAFGWIEKVVLMSGTLPPDEYLYDLYGLDDIHRHTEPMQFPKGRRPVTIIPVARVSYKDPDSYKKVAVAADRFVGRNLHVKGLIHTGNYQMAEALKKVTRNAGALIFYDTASRRGAIEEFKRARAPAYLVGPSLTEGLDLPYDQVRAQLVLKLPIPNLADPWVAAMREQVKGWDGFRTAMSIAQAYGRGIRAKDDWADFYVLDANIKWHMGAFKEFYPKWFREAVKWEA